MAGSTTANRNRCIEMTKKSTATGGAATKGGATSKRASAGGSARRPATATSKSTRAGGKASTTSPRTYKKGGGDYKECNQLLNVCRENNSLIKNLQTDNRCNSKLVHETIFEKGCFRGKETISGYKLFNGEYIMKPDAKCRIEINNAHDKCKKPKPRAVERTLESIVKELLRNSDHRVIQFKYQNEDTNLHEYLENLLTSIMNLYNKISLAKVIKYLENKNNHEKKGLYHGQFWKQKINIKKNIKEDTNALSEELKAVIQKVLKELESVEILDEKTYYDIWNSKKTIEISADLYKQLYKHREYNSFKIALEHLKELTPNSGTQSGVTQSGGLGDLITAFFIAGPFIIGPLFSRFYSNSPQKEGDTY